MAIITKYWQNGDTLTLNTSARGITISSVPNKTGAARQTTITVKTTVGNLTEVVTIKQGYIEKKYAVAHVSGTFTNPRSALYAPNNVWAGVLNKSTSQSSIFQMDAPTAPMNFNIQTFSVICRKGSNTANPTIDLNLYENGTYIMNLVTAVPITSTVSQTVTATFDPKAIRIRDYSKLQIQVVSNAVGGNSLTKNSTQIDAIIWSREIDV